jgi:hypothetical protein
MFPAWHFHKDLAPEGQVFQTAEDLARAEDDNPGWQDTPAKFDPKYVAPPPSPVAPEDRPADQPGYVPVTFPSLRHNQAGEERRVETKDEADALEAAEPGVWKDTPDPDAWDPVKWAKKQAARAAGAGRTLPTPETPALRTDGPTLEEFVAKGYKAEGYPPSGYAEKPSPALVEFRAQQAGRVATPAVTPKPAPANPNPESKSPEELERDQQRAEQWALPEKGVLAAIKANDNAATLQKMREYEAANPSGTRAKVLEAIDAKLKAL